MENAKCMVIEVFVDLGLREKACDSRRENVSFFFR